MSQPPRYSYPGFDPGAADGSSPYGTLPVAPEASQGFMDGIVLFDPATDSSPYAAKHKKKKGRPSGKPSAKPSKKAQQKALHLAQAGQAAAPAPSAPEGYPPLGAPSVLNLAPDYTPRVDSHDALRIVSDDPSEIRLYAEAQRRSDAGRTLAGIAPQAPMAPMTPMAPAAGTPSAAPFGAAPASPAQEGVRPGASPWSGYPPVGGPDAQAGAPNTSSALPTWSSYEIDDDPDHPRPSARRRKGSIASVPEGPIVFASESAQADSGTEKQRPRWRLRAHRKTDGDLEQEAAEQAGEAGGDEAGTVEAATDDGAGRKARRKRRRAQAKAARAERRPAVRRALDPEALWRAGIVALTSVAAVLTTIVMLYFPAQSVYLNMRENERLNDELSQNLSRNEQMQERVDTLQTAEGVQDEARRVFGLVLPGDNAVSVVGVDYEEPTNAVPLEIPRGSGENTDTWATDLLDRVFGVTGPETSTATSSDVATLTDQAAEAEGVGQPADDGAPADGTSTPAS